MDGTWLLNGIKTAVGATMGLFLQLPLAPQLLLWLMAGDMGLAACMVLFSRQLNSDDLFKGFSRKAAILIMVTVAHAVSHYAILMDAPWAVGVAYMLTWAFVAHEMVCIGEHATRLGLPLPQVWQAIIDVVKSQNGANK